MKKQELSIIIVATFIVLLCYIVVKPNSNENLEAGLVSPTLLESEERAEPTLPAVEIKVDVPEIETTEIRMTMEDTIETETETETHHETETETDPIIESTTTVKTAPTTIIAPTTVAQTTPAPKISTSKVKEYSDYDVDTRTKIIYDYLLARVGNPKGVAALMGNLQAESGLISFNLQNKGNVALGLSDYEYTNAVDNGSYTKFVNDGYGYGLAQWTFWSRKQNLIDMARRQGKSVGNLDLQLDYLWWEIHDYYTPVYTQMKNCTDIYSTCTYILEEWERPGVINDSVRNDRYNMARSIYDRFN